jgi:hypothetical protein
MFRGMSVARIAVWLPVGGLLALAVAPLGCGERAGDAVIALPAGEDPPPLGSGGGESEEPPLGDAGAPEGSAPLGPGGLCAPCVSSRECGDANDACVVHGSERFCGRDCDARVDCPDGYSCVGLSNSQLSQCVPNTTCPVVEGAPPPLEEVRSYLLARINGERAAQARSPLTGSTCLDQVAQQSAVDFARADAPFGKFLEECEPTWPSCECGWWAQAELTISRYDLDWRTAVDGAVGPTRDDATEPFARAYLSTMVTDVGIGFWLSGDEAWIALSFH